MPVKDRAGQRQQCRLAPVEPPAELPQIGKPHTGLFDAARREGRRAQHIERRLGRRQIKRKMRVLLDDPDKHQFARCTEPFLAGDIIADQRG